MHTMYVRASDGVLIVVQPIGASWERPRLLGRNNYLLEATCTIFPSKSFLARRADSTSSVQLWDQPPAVWRSYRPFTPVYTRKAKQPHIQNLLARWHRSSQKYTYIHLHGVVGRRRSTQTIMLAHFGNTNTTKTYPTFAKNTSTSLTCASITVKTNPQSFSIVRILTKAGTKCISSSDYRSCLLWPSLPLLYPFVAQAPHHFLQLT